MNVVVVSIKITLNVTSRKVKEGTHHDGESEWETRMEGQVYESEILQVCKSEIDEMVKCWYTLGGLWEEYMHNM